MSAGLFVGGLLGSELDEQRHLTAGDQAGLLIGGPLGSGHAGLVVRLVPGLLGGLVLRLVPGLLGGPGHGALADLLGLGGLGGRAVEELDERL